MQGGSVEGVGVSDRGVRGSTGAVIVTFGAAA